MGIDSKVVNRLKLAGKLLVSTSLLGYLLWRVDTALLLTQIAQLAIWAIIAVVASRIGAIVTHIIRWHLLLKGRAITVPFLTSVRLILIGNFFSLFMPGNIGGDVYRVYGIRAEAKSLLQSTGLVVFERYCGFLSDFILAIPALCMGDLFLREPAVAMLVLALTVAFIVPVSMSANNRITEFLMRAFLRINFHKGAQLIQRISSAVRSLIFDKKLVMIVLCLSVLMKLLAGLQIYFFARGMAINMRLLDLMVFMPLHHIVSALPVSISGLGVREANMVVFFTRMGMTNDQITGVAFLSLVWFYISSLPGGLYLLFNRKKPADAQP